MPKKAILVKISPPSLLSSTLRRITRKCTLLGGTVLSWFLFRTSTISGQRKEGVGLLLLAVGISIKSIVQGAIALLLGVVWLLVFFSSVESRCFVEKRQWMHINDSNALSTRKDWGSRKTKKKEGMPLNCGGTMTRFSCRQKSWFPACLDGLQSIPLLARWR